MMAHAGKLFDDVPAARLLSQSLENQRQSVASRRTRRHGSPADCIDDDGLGGEAHARARQSLQLPALAQNLNASQRGDDLLAHRGAFATAFDKLKAGAAAEVFFRKYIATNRDATHLRRAHESV